MDLGFKLPTQGLLAHDAAGNAIIQRLEPDDFPRLLDVARYADEFGFHSAWFPDHVVTERVTDANHPANSSGQRAYPDRPNMLDCAVMMAAVAASTTHLRIAPSVYIAPYRHPLNSAHQFATLDVISGGRLIVGIGVGWEKGEFDALGVSHTDRAVIAEESIQIYKSAWTDPWIEFHGRHFDIVDVSMDPKPVQRPHPPLWYGGVTPAGARVAARHCDALYPLFLDSKGHFGMWDHLRDEVRREGERIGRDLSGFTMGAYAAARLTDEPLPADRPILNGNGEQVLEDLLAFAAHGYSHISLNFNCPSASVSELFEQLQRAAEQLLEEAAGLTAASVV